MSEVAAYPLTWPPGWPRTHRYSRTHAKFHDGKLKPLDVGQGTKRVIGELSTMGVHPTRIIISSELRLRGDGLPYAQQATSNLDPGVAVYWSLSVNGKTVQRCIASDRYDRIADNLAAIAATLEAMRAIQRHGGSTILDRAFMGFTALPAPEQWFSILGVPATAEQAVVDQAHRRLVLEHHPDRGGDCDKAARVNTARDDAYRINGWR